jgi:hypothetical protein
MMDVRGAWEGAVRLFLLEIDEKDEIGSSGSSRRPSPLRTSRRGIWQLFTGGGAPGK